MPPVLPKNKRQCQPSDLMGYNLARIYHRKAGKHKDACFRIKCGCCDQSLEIYYDKEGESLEINGVLATVQNWQAILLPLLRARDKRSKK